MPKLPALLALSLLLHSPSWAQSTTSSGQRIVELDPVMVTQFDAVRSDSRVQQALRQLEVREPEAVAEQIRLTEIPAPPFQESRRAEYFLERIKERGFPDAYIDEEGNVVAKRSGTGGGPTLLIAAHLDTVFPADIDTTVNFRDGRYYAPGIGDDTRGLATLLSTLDVLNESDLTTQADLIFSGNVGEEGRGDLRGIKALFRDHPEVDGFISVDGVRLQRITNGGTGSRRFEFIFKGPGGHSFGAFGLPSAIHAMGRAIAKIAELQTPRFPKTTFTVGTVDGGTSVNSIAADAVFALDMRSNDRSSLALLEREAKAAALTAVSEENARWGQNLISVEFKLIGDRPVGRTDPSSSVVQAAAMAFDALGIELTGLGISSTDSNVPMSLNIPAITIAGGGGGGGAHSPDEWFSPVNSHQGPQMLLLTLLALAGIEGVSEPLLEETDN